MSSFRHWFRWRNRYIALRIIEVIAGAGGGCSSGRWVKWLEAREIAFGAPSNDVAHATCDSMCATKKTVYRLFETREGIDFTFYFSDDSMMLWWDDAAMRQRCVVANNISHQCEGDINDQDPHMVRQHKNGNPFASALAACRRMFAGAAWLSTKSILWCSSSLLIVA